METLLTLFVVPCAYSLFAKIERKQYATSSEARLADATAAVI